MTTIDFSLPSGRIFLRNDEGEEFLPLGAVHADSLADSAVHRIRGETKEADPDLWGTLGMLHPDDAGEKAYSRTHSMLAWKGQLHFSTRGNLDSTPDESGEATLSEIGDVYEGRRQDINEGPGRKVIERYISFENAEYTAFPEVFTWDQIPRLRLALFLKPSQGALVFYQHMDDGPLRLGAQGDGTSVQYIQPRPTKGDSTAFDVGPNPDHDCSHRDRLHYEIPLLPRECLEEVVGDAAEAEDETPPLLRRSGRVSGEKLVIKALVFDRGNSTSLQIVKRLASNLQKERYGLHLWNREDGYFQPVLPGDVKRDSGRTLLCLHGTFSSTEGSFGRLTSGNTASWMGQLAAKARYDQILAFDHSTIFDGPAENAERLRAHLGGTLDNPMHVLTHSRGGLLARELALYQPGFIIDRGALVASANGVGYFRAGRRVANFLSVLRSMFKVTGRPAAAFVAGLAQHSATFFLNLPGCRAMTPGSAELQRLIGTPWSHPHPAPTFLPVIGDYDRGIAAGERFLKRIRMNGLDLVIKAFLGRYHDWVVGTREQSLIGPGIAAAGYDPAAFRTSMVAARHTRYYDIPQVQQLLTTFLH